MKKKFRIVGTGRERVDKYQEPPKKIPAEVSECIDEYKLDIDKLRRLDSLDDYLAQHDVDEDCMDIVNMHISRVRPPQRPTMEFRKQLKTCHDFITKTGIGNDDTTSADLFKLIQTLKKDILQKGQITVDDKTKIFLLSKCYTAYFLYGL